MKAPAVRHSSEKVSACWHPCARTHAPLCQDADPCAVIESNRLVLAFPPHPDTKTPIRAKTPISAKTPILTLLQYVSHPTLRAQRILRSF